MEDGAELLKRIREEVLALESSPLYGYRKENDFLPVIGEGNPRARIMFVGEAPGKNEALTGRPFCGAAGRVLDELLAGIGLARADVYITNIVKDRPPENRDPSPEEIRVYGPFLDRQIEAVRPEVIAALGRFSTKYLLEKFGQPEAAEPIGRLRGKPVEARASYGPVKILPLYHPAVALYNGGSKAGLAEDFKILKTL